MTGNSSLNFSSFSFSSVNNSIDFCHVTSAEFKEYISKVAVLHRLVMVILLGLCAYNLIVNPILYFMGRIDLVRLEFTLKVGIVMGVFAFVFALQEFFLII